MPRGISCQVGNFGALRQDIWGIWGWNNGGTFWNRSENRPHGHDQICWWARSFLAVCLWISAATWDTVVTLVTHKHTDRHMHAHTFFFLCSPLSGSTKCGCLSTFTQPLPDCNLQQLEGFKWITEGSGETFVHIWERLHFRMNATLILCQSPLVWSFFNTGSDRPSFHKK